MWVTFVAVVVLYVILGAAFIITLRAMARRWRATDEPDDDVPYGPAPSEPPAVVAGGSGSAAPTPSRSWGAGATMYAVFGGADFGAGLWSLLAGGGDRGRAPRELIDWAIGPVWEANHAG